MERQNPSPLRITWQIKGQEREIQFDAVLTEEHAAPTTVTQHPVEKGATISDHVRPEQERVTIQALVTNTPIKGPPTQNKGATERQLTRQVRGEMRIRGIPVPVIRGASVLDFTAEMDRPADVWAELRDIRDNARLISIDNGLHRYDDMVIDGLTVPREAGSRRDALTFSISAVKLRIVDSREVKSQKTQTAKKRTDKGHQGTKTVDSGDQKSVLFSAKEAVF